MSRPDSLLLLISLLVGGGSASPQTRAAKPDAGLVVTGPDAGVVAATSDAGMGASQPASSKAIPWPEEELTPLATLEGPAILAAHAALQQVMKRFPKEYTRQCAFSPKSLEFIIGYQAGWYFIRVNHRVDQCPGWGPGVTVEFDWNELYAYSPDGRLERYPSMP